MLKNVFDFDLTTDIQARMIKGEAA